MCSITSRESVTIPKPSVARPATSTSPPSSARRRKGAAVVRATSWMAAIGGVRAARTAGKIAEPTVTNSPTAIAATTVRPRSTVPVSGTSKPKLSTASSRRPAMPTPTASPTTDASTPTTRRFDDDRRQHLASARAQRADEPELPRALGNQDRERVDDDERADDEPDRRRSRAARH